MYPKKLLQYYPINTPSPTHPVNIPYQHTLSSHPVNALSQPLLFPSLSPFSQYPLNSSYQPLTPSQLPLTPSQPPLTPSLNPSNLPSLSSVSPRLY